MADTSQVREITAKLEQGVKDLFKSDRYADYLKTMSRFHKYSTRNTLLIHMQKPDATLVAGFRSWQNKFGRSVKKGEKSIKILAPVPFVKREEKEKLDPDTRQPIIGDDGLPLVEYTERHLARFKVTSVFDVSQTAGKPLPTLAQNLAGDVEQYKAFMDALRAVSPLPIVFEPMPDEQDGLCRFGKEIAIRTGMSEIQTVCAVIHEMTHAKLHDKSITVDVNGGAAPKDRRTEEVEAESVSYAVCQYFGIETGDNSFGYLAEWSKTRELKELNASLDTIRKTAAELIETIDGKFKEIVKDRNRTLAVGESQAELAAPAAAKQAPGSVPEIDREAIIKRIMDYILKDDPEHPQKNLDYIKNNMRKKPIEDLVEFDFAFYFPGENPPLVGTAQETLAPIHASLENKLYDKFSELFPQAMSGEYSYLRLEAGDGFMPLSLEWIGDNQLSVMHTYTLNGDLCYDPMVVYEVDSDAKTMTAVSFEQSIPPIYQVVDEGGDGRDVDGNGNERTIRGLQSQINDFSETWFQNIGEQGYMPVKVNMDIGGEYTQITFDADGHPIQPKQRDVQVGDVLLIQDKKWLVEKIDGNFSVSLKNLNSDDIQSNQMFIGRWKEKLAEAGYTIIAAPESEQPPPPKEYDLGYGFLGNGITVWNRAEEKDGDYRTVAHVATDRSVTFYDDDMHHEVRERIDTVANSPDTEAFGFSPAPENVPPRIDGAPAPTIVYETIKWVMPEMAEPKTPAPDSSIGYSEMNLYGYMADGMLPLTQSRVTELYDAGLTVYLLYPDNTEAMVFDRDEITAHDGIFGIERTEWETTRAYAEMKAESKTREGSREAELLYGSGNRFGIYQVKDGADHLRDYRFVLMEELQALGLDVSRGNYELVYTAEFPEKVEYLSDRYPLLNRIYQEFNVDHPADYSGRSVSVSDVVVLKCNSDISSHYVDRAGFVEIDYFLGEEKAQLPEMPAQAVEKSKQEKTDNYSQVGNSRDDERPTIPKGRPTLAERLAENKLKAARQGQPEAHKPTEREVRV